MNDDKVYLVWKDINTGKKFKVGILYKEDNMFYFRYVLENLKEAEKHGFHLLIPFPNFNAIYFFSHLFHLYSAKDLAVHTTPQPFLYYHKIKLNHVYLSL